MPDGLDGKSLLPQLENPQTASLKPAFSFYEDGQTSVRVDKWRLIMHREGDKILGYELFDFNDDNQGIRKDPEKYAELIENLSNNFDSLSWISH